jgi:hypothetical protein
MIQKKMQFDGPFGAAKVSPVKHLQTQINDGRIHTDQLVLKPKLFLSDHLDTASIKEFQEDLLIEFPGAVLIGISQGGMTGGTNSKMFQFALATSETSCNLSEGMGPTQLTKEHGHKLAPTGESSGMTFGLGLYHHLLEF